MPRQNRVTPWGYLIATPARGTLFGNRGCLHDNGEQIKRLFQVKRWIYCQLALRPGRSPRPPLPPGFYTGLFFLDEATALRNYQRTRDEKAAALVEATGEPKKAELATKAAQVRYDE